MALSMLLQLALIVAKLVVQIPNLPSWAVAALNFLIAALGQVNLVAARGGSIAAHQVVPQHVLAKIGPVLPAEPLTEANVMKWAEDLAAANAA